MLVIPAIDILGGRCVRLVRGDFEDPKVYSDDPADVVAGFSAAGAKRVHMVDLDAARGSGDNRTLIESILRRGDIDIEVAGGVRTAETVDSWIAAGAHAVVNTSCGPRVCAIGWSSRAWPYPVGITIAFMLTPFCSSP